VTPDYTRLRMAFSFSQPAYLSGDQSNLSFPLLPVVAADVRIYNIWTTSSRPGILVRKRRSVTIIAAIRLISRLTVEGARPSNLAIERAD